MYQKDFVGPSTKANEIEDFYRYETGDPEPFISIQTSNGSSVVLRCVSDDIGEDYD